MKRELANEFRVRICGTEEWKPFSIPGSVMSAYHEAGVIEDPYDRMNEYAVRKFLKQDFEIKGTFTVSREELEKENLEIVFSRVDTVADFYINDHFLGHGENMHRSYLYTCGEWLVEGVNTIRICLYSAEKFIQNYPVSKGREIHMANTGTLHGEQYLRKAHCMFGWDWGPILPDAGIYGGIEFWAYDGAKLESTLVRQTHQKQQVVLSLNTSVSEHGQKNYEISYELVGPDGSAVVEQTTDTTLVITEPELWWPNGYGKQPLYHLNVYLNSDSGLQKKSYTIGLRELKISQDEDEWGKEFAFWVNGVKIFARGADYIPEDCFYSKITRQVLERNVRAAVFANFNCLRIWGGGYYPTDEFYELCDQAGIIIWQDLMYACNIYDINDAFIANIQEEARENLIRFRNHPSLGMICGNNEMEIAWLEWKDMQDHAPSLKRDYLMQFEYYLAKVVKETAPDTFYWPSSPSSGGSFDDPGDENRGDSHYWDVWHGQKPFTEYQKHFFRFCSEFGFQSFPSMKTIESFTVKEDRNMFSKVMESHQKNPSANGKILYYLSETFRFPKNLEQTVFLSQIMQGYAIKSAVEHWRRNRGRCMGSIYWQFNDNWPVASWASMDYYGRYKALHYMAKEFYAPLAGSIQREKTCCNFWISNETKQTRNLEIEIYLKDCNFEVLSRKKMQIQVDKLSSVCVAQEDYEELVAGREDKVFAVMKYRDMDDPDREIKSEFELFVPMKYFELEEPNLWIERENETSILLHADSFVPYCMLEALETDVVMSKNAFSILSSEPVRIELEKPGDSAEGVTDLANLEYRIYDIFHSYEH